MNLHERHPPLDVHGGPRVAVLPTPELAVFLLNAGHAGATVAPAPRATDVANKIVTPEAADGVGIISSKRNPGTAAGRSIRPGGEDRLWGTAGGEASGASMQVVAGKRLIRIRHETVGFGLDDVTAR